MIRPEELVGRCLSQVTCSWFRGAEGDELELVHLWLNLDGLGPVRFHTLDHILDLRIDEPHGRIDMGEYGQITVGAAPEGFPLRRFVGQSVQAVREVRQVSLGSSVGIRLDFAGGEVRVLALADELVVADGLLSDQWEADLELVDSGAVCPSPSASPAPTPTTARPCNPCPRRPAHPLPPRTAAPPPRQAPC